MRGTVTTVGGRLIISGLDCIMAQKIRGARLGRSSVGTNDVVIRRRVRRSSLEASIMDAMGCSLLNGVTAGAQLAHGAVTKVLSRVVPDGFSVCGIGPRRFVHEMDHLVLRRGTAVVMSRVDCGRVRKDCSSTVFARRGRASLSGTCRNEGDVISCIFASKATGRDIRHGFMRSLSADASITMCTGLPGNFRVPAPINGCSPS